MSCGVVIDVWLSQLNTQVSFHHEASQWPFSNVNLCKYYMWLLIWFAPKFNNFLRVAAFLKFSNFCCMWCSWVVWPGYGCCRLYLYCHQSHPCSLPRLVFLYLEYDRLELYLFSVLDVQGRLLIGNSSIKMWYTALVFIICNSVHRNTLYLPYYKDNITNKFSFQ